MKMQKQIKNKKRKWKKSEWDEVSLLVHMHCDGCATKLMRYLRGFEGLHEVKSDGKSYMVIVKREAVDPLAVKERIERKSHGSVEIIHMNIKANDSKQTKQKEKSSLRRIQKIPWYNVFANVIKFSGGVPAKFCPLTVNSAATP